MSSQIQILGGGPAGLALSYYSRTADIEYQLFEAGNQVGGNAVTYHSGEFAYDSGAHRFHDKDRDITEEILSLMGDGITKIEAPSQIFSHGKFIHFPLSPFNLAVNLGFRGLMRAMSSWIQGQLFHSADTSSFESMTRSKYGAYLADRFLLNYSEKLWGIKPDLLSAKVAGNRLKGLDIKTFIIEAIRGSKAKTTHLDGAFYYPKNGYGNIMTALAGNDQGTAIETGAAVTAIHHENFKIKSIELNNERTVEASQVISTLPLGKLVRMLSPTLPDNIIHLSRQIKFRSLILLAIFIDKESLSDNASIYFPDPTIPFTRGYEPRNRCRTMSPENKTSLVVEIPCYHQDSIWTEDESTVAERSIKILTNTGLFKKEEVLGWEIKRMDNAYPVLSQEATKYNEEIIQYLTKFENLTILGRNGRFEYTHTHDLMRDAKTAIHDYLDKHACTI